MLKSLGYRKLVDLYNYLKRRDIQFSMLLLEMERSVQLFLSPRMHYKNHWESGGSRVATGRRRQENTICSTSSLAGGIRPSGDEKIMHAGARGRVAVEPANKRDPSETLAVLSSMVLGHTNEERNRLWPEEQCSSESLVVCTCSGLHVFCSTSSQGRQM